MRLSRNQLSEDLMRVEGFNMEPNNVTGFLNVCNYSPLIHASETTGEVSQREASIAVCRRVGHGFAVRCYLSDSFTVKVRSEIASPGNVCVGGHFIL
jgi:hypothetical protein